jgi:hypothetical protein
MRKSVVRKNPEFLMREVGETLKVISLVNGEEFVVDGLAMKLLQMVDGHRAWGEIVDLVCVADNIQADDRNDFQTDADGFFKELIQNKIVLAS